MTARSLLLCAIFMFAIAAKADDHLTDAGTDILVTLVNDGGAPVSGSIRAPYQARQRYSIAAEVRRNAADLADEYGLERVDEWPIRALDVYCIVLRPQNTADRDRLIALLEADERVESAQPLNEFETGTDDPAAYNDTYAALQHGLDALDVAPAHDKTLGDGIRVAIVDSHVDKSHEDLRGRLKQIKVLTDRDREADREHGTAIASVIAANANNRRGIVGVAPEAELELYVSCWSADDRQGAVCNSFTLAKALDRIAADPPDILNMSLAGPADPLLQRLLQQTVAAGVVVIAASPRPLDTATAFPAGVPGVIAVSNPYSADQAVTPDESLFAPGEQIMVALPGNSYEMRSGSSLSAAHTSGVAALLLSVAPGISADELMQMLRQSQSTGNAAGRTTINACRAMTYAGLELDCRRPTRTTENSELKPGA